MAKEIILPFSELKATLDDTPIEPTLEITENGVYNVKGYVYADVNTEGGGSSDFSTAKVTATYILPEGVDSPEELSLSNSTFIIIKAEDNEYFDPSVTFLYGGNGLPLNMLGSVSQINVPLFSPDEYFTHFDVSFKLQDESTLSIDVTNSNVVSGDAVIDNYNGYIIITGDCVLNLALMN